VDYEVTLSEVEARPLAVVQQRVPVAEVPSSFSELLGIVWAYLRGHGLKNLGHNVMVYDDDSLIELGVEVFEPLPDDHRVRPSQTPSGRVAGTVHWGDYAALGDAHVAVQRWCADNDRQVTGRRWEVYGDWFDDPAKVRTDVFYELK
jgi:hypothetical protein